MLGRSLFSINLPKDILTALTRNGYQTIQDVTATNPEILAKDLSIGLQEVHALLNSLKHTGSQVANAPISQSALVMLQQSPRINSKCAALDNVLGGGLKRCHMLEISGPPGSPKEKLLINLVSVFADADEDIIFVDCANMTSPTILNQSLDLVDSSLKSKIHYKKLHSLPEFLLFLHQLPAIMALAKASLLVINSISFPVQCTNSLIQRNAHLEKLKQCFLKLCASNNCTVVISSQLSTKMVNADGTKGSYDSGARGIMLPQLGPSYLPVGRSYRVLISPTDSMSGFIKLLSSPKYPPGKAPLITAAYSMVDGKIV